MSPAAHRAFGTLATAVVAGAVVWGIVVVGTPETRRLERLDDRRLEHLQAIHAEILDLVRDPGDRTRLRRALPATLEELAAQARRRRIVTKDPATGAPYRYEVRGDGAYELCATFDQPRQAEWGVFWNHPAGTHCFRIDVLDPP